MNGAEKGGSRYPPGPCAFPLTRVFLLPDILPNSLFLALLGARQQLESHRTFENKKGQLKNQLAFLIFMVPKGGLEPPRVSPLPPQDSVSANSTTSACKQRGKKSLRH